MSASGSPLVRPFGASWPVWLYAAALVCGVAPLWASQALPLVDLPQHLHLISVLHRLDDPTTLYPRLFEARGTLTPYLGYYDAVSVLGWVLPLETANRVFLSACVAGLPLSLAFLLRSVGRPAWPSLLALPFAYGDSFAWGFINWCASVPLALLTCGLFVRALVDAPRRRAWAAGLAVALVAVLLFHVMAFAFLAVALPLLLFTTPVPEDTAAEGRRARLLPRLPALVAVVPGVALCLAWVVLRLGDPADVEAGAPWKAWGPMLSPQNLAWKSLAQNRSDLPRVLANMLRDGSDRWALVAVAVVVALSLVAGAFPRARGEPGEGPVARWRMAGLGLVALALYFLLPFDIRGYMYYLNTRYAHLAAALLVGAVPVLRPGLQRVGVVAGAVASLVLAVPLVRGFRAFDREAAAVREVSASAGRAPMVMGLVYDTGSRVVRHPVFLHAAATVARESGGATNFSFALTPHSPLKYRGTPPPTFPSEWRPDQFSWEAHGAAYDHFLLRGVHPATVFGSRLGTEVEVAAQADGVWLVRRARGT
ncbi:MAG: hypothetical protein L0Y64_15800, partial [Myxococcaceae bacterium]|nr:hypothetical protein [Myxococcaceae bacterium]